MHYLSHYESLLGAVAMASDDEHLTGLRFDGQKYDHSTISDDAVLRPRLSVFVQTAQWFGAYLEDIDPGFTPSTRVEGPDFRIMVTSTMLFVLFGAISIYIRIVAEVVRRTGRTHMPI